MKKLFLFFAFAFLSNTASAQTTWKVDPMHSFASFNIKHMGISFVEGRFDKIDGTVTTSGNALNNAKFDFMIDVNSINTNVEMRDNHLKSADFFDTENYPAMTFESTKITKVDDDEYKLEGLLTMKGVSKEITLDVEFGGTNKDPWGNEKAGFSLNGKINRKDWGLNWNAALETGGVLVSDEVKIASEVQFVKQQ